MSGDDPRQKDVLGWVGRKHVVSNTSDTPGEAPPPFTSSGAGKPVETQTSAPHQAESGSGKGSSD